MLLAQKPSVLVFFSLFSTQNQVSQITTGMSWVIYQIQAFSVVIKTSCEIILSVLRKTDIWSHFLANKVSVQGLQKLKYKFFSRENLVLLK